MHFQWIERQKRLRVSGIILTLPGKPGIRAMLAATILAGCGYLAYLTTLDISLHLDR